jgi:4-hydroxy-2-oxovalerate aldolase
MAKEGKRSLKVKLLDTTLRDGSYATGFSFSRRDTALIAGALDAAGFEFIEVGHGVGLNASRMGKGLALHSDIEYVKSAVSAVKRARVGVFCVPGIAEVRHVEAAAAAGISFIRVGTNATEVETSEAIIRRSKELGLFVFANYMKSYTVSPDRFAEQARKSRAYGADAIYVVDSAGGMFPRDIARYFRAVNGMKGGAGVPLGFHGHDNLSMAVSNSLRAVELGAAFVDVSLQGLGRSAGNAAAETLVACLVKRYGYDAIDLMAVIAASRRYVAPLHLGRAVAPLDLIAGFSDFHSSYMRDIQRVSADHGIDPLALILKYAKRKNVGMDVHALEEDARALEAEGDHATDNYDFSRYHGHEQN